MPPQTTTTHGDGTLRPDLLEHVPTSLWSRAHEAPCRLLMLDYDGTLAPFRIDRGRASPHPDSARYLSSIARSAHTRVALVSGRPMRELRVLVEESGITAASWAGAAVGDGGGDAPPSPEPDTLEATSLVLFGEHGWERLQPTGEVVEFPMPESATAGLREGANAVAATTWVDRVERKRTGLVLHTRGLEHEDTQRAHRECEELWRPIAEQFGLRLDRTDGGFDLRARERDKRTAVVELIREAPAETLPIYVGDDVTDEDAFEAVREAGYGLLVSPLQRQTLAAGWLPGPDGMVAFLERWWKDVEAKR